MKTLSANIPTSLGDIINLKAHLDSVKHEYEQINLTYHKQLWRDCLHLNAEQEQDWHNYTDELSKLFFSEKPYATNNGQYKFYCTDNLIGELQIPVIKPKLAHLLCKGDPLNIGEYIVVTTKVRGVKQLSFMPRLALILQALAKSKSKIVVLGEREVEMRTEYNDLAVQGTIFGIYPQIISGFPQEQVIDLTIPALGNSQSTLKQIQQDCLIMNKAKAVIAIGHGGNVGMAMASESNVIGYREQSNWFGEQLFANTNVTKDWNQFINKLYELV